MPSAHSYSSCPRPQCAPRSCRASNRPREARLAERPDQTARLSRPRQPQALDGPDHAPAVRCRSAGPWLPVTAHRRPAGHLGETCSVYQHASAAWRARRPGTTAAPTAHPVASRRRPGPDPGPVPSLSVPPQELVANPFIITRPKCPTLFYLMCLSPSRPNKRSAVCREACLRRAMLRRARTTADRRGRWGRCYFFGSGA